MPTAQKQATVERLRERVTGAPCAIVCDYRGLRVTQINELRRQVRDSDADFRVVKNRLMKIAVEGTAAAPLCELLVGPTAIAFCDDPVPAAKALADFAAEHGVITIKGAVGDGQLYSAEDVQKLAELLPRPQLLAQLVAGFNGPIAGLVYTLGGILSALIFTLHAIAQKAPEAEQ